LGVRTTQSPSLRIWKALYSADQALTTEEIAERAGLPPAMVESVVQDPFYRTYGIMTEAEWEAAHPPRPLVEDEDEDEGDPGEPDGAFEDSADEEA
jgi:hypothetical protein